MPTDSLADRARSLTTRTLTYATAHKVTAGVVVLLVLVIGYYAVSALAKGPTTTTYVTANAVTGTIVSTVSGSGQISATTQVALKPQGSGNVVYIGVKQGEQVKKGTLLVELDPTDGEKAVRDAQANLTGAQISYQQAISSAGNTTESGRDNGFDTATTAFSDLSSITQGLDATLLGTSAGYAGEANVSAYADLIAPYEPTAEFAGRTAQASYQAALSAYNQSFALYQTVSRTSSASDVQNLLTTTNDATVKVNQATKDALAFLTLVQTTITNHNQLKTPPALASQISAVTGYESKVSGDSASVLSALTALQNATAVLANSGDTAPLAIQSAQLNLTKAQNALQDAHDTLSDYYLYAPFDGTVATLGAIVGESVGTSAVTMIGSQQSAVLSLDEVDAAKIKLGQKATLTFDAVDGLTLTGTVTGVDTLGTVTQGVVTYDVTISLDSQDARVKPGMTVSAAIITDTAVDVITVPSSAVKTINGTTYVQVFNPALSASTTSATGGIASATPPKNLPVTTGISDDTDTEILSGLREGEQVVVRTSTTATATAARTTTTTAGAARGGGTNVLRGL
jgi:HlyD family secretion protein